MPGRAHTVTLALLTILVVITQPRLLATESSLIPRPILAADPTKKELGQLQTRPIRQTPAALAKATQWVDNIECLPDVRFRSSARLSPIWKKLSVLCFQIPHVY